MENDFAVRVGLEHGLALELLAQDAVVVDLAVHGKEEGTLFVDQGLRTRVYFSVRLDAQCQAQERAGNGSHQCRQCSNAHESELRKLLETRYFGATNGAGTYWYRWR